MPGFLSKRGGASGSALIAAGMLALTLAVGGVDGSAGVSRAAALPMRVSVTVSKAGRYEVALRYQIATRRGATCSAAVHAGRGHTSLPNVIARSGRVAWRWIVPSGAFSGAWRFKATCLLNGLSAARTNSPIILIPADRKTTALMAAGSLSITAGVRAVPVSPQGKSKKQVVGSVGKGSGGGNPGDWGYCTYGAWDHAPWLGRSVWGNAKDWYAAAKQSGLPTGPSPCLGRSSFVPAAVMATWVSLPGSSTITPFPRWR